MKRVFIDTNVLIDYLGHRESFYVEAAVIFSLAKNKKIQLLVSSLSIVTASYVLKRHYSTNHELIIEDFKRLIELCHITTIDVSTIMSAVDSAFKDFEDAVQHFSALSASADVIVTRNEVDFKESLKPVMSPTAFLSSILP